MATLTAGEISLSSNVISCSVTVSGLDTSFIGSRQIRFYLVQGPSWIEQSRQSISGDGTYNFTTTISSTSLTSGNYYAGFELYYQQQNESSWTYSLNALSSNYVQVIARPNNFIFSSNIQSGAATTTLTADTWNNFCTRINEFRQYKGLSNYSFTSVSSGSRMTAAIMAQPWDAINAINGHGTMPTRPSQGATIYASYFHTLAAALNNIT